jgi:MFS family permease
MTISPYGALKIRDYRLLLAGRLFVSVAVLIQAVAIGWQVYSLTKDPLSLGLIGLSEAFPAIGISLYAGHINDIFDRKLIALGAIAILIISFASLSILSAGYIGMPILLISIYCINALTGFARGFYAPAVFAMISHLVPRELYGNAAAWTSAFWQASSVIGPCSAGFLYVWLGTSKTYLMSTILLTIAFFIFLFIKADTKPSAKEDTNMIRNIREGLNFVFSNQIISGAMVLDLFAVLFGGAVALLPMFTAEVFHCGPQMLGILRAAPSVGALLTASFLAHRPIFKNAGLVLFTCVAGFGLCMILFGLSTNIYFSLFLLCLSGALDGISVWIRNTIFQLVTPHNMKGRVAALNNMALQSSNEIGEFESGVAAKLMGLVPSVIFGGCATLIIVLVTAFKTPKLRKLHLQHLYDINAKT